MPPMVKVVDSVFGKAYTHEPDPIWASDALLDATMRGVRVVSTHTEALHVSGGPYSDLRSAWEQPQPSRGAHEEGEEREEVGVVF
jgi:hypothetical protein